MTEKSTTENQAAEPKDSREEEGEEPGERPEQMMKANRPEERRKGSREGEEIGALVAPEAEPGTTGEMKKTRGEEEPMKKVKMTNQPRLSHLTMMTTKVITKSNLFF